MRENGEMRIRESAGHGVPRTGNRSRWARTRRSVRASAVLAAALATGLGVPVSPAQETAPDGDGAALYHQYCSVCHGDRGDGKSRVSKSLTPPPRDFSTPAAAGALTREQMIASVSNGVPETAMSGWAAQLDPDQIAAVVDFVRDAFMLPAARHDTDRARLIYAEYCSVCHGDRGDGKSRAAGSMVPPPRDFTAARASSELTRERMIFSVTYGRANTAMAPWGTQLNAEEIDATVDFIRGRFMREAPGVAEASADHGHAASGHAHRTPTGDLAAYMAEPMPRDLEGNARWGKWFYARSCATCHGTDGDGQGPRAYFILPKPRDFGHPAARAELNRPHLFDTIAKGANGTEMAAWDKVLTDFEIASVAEYVFQAFIREEAAPGAEARQDGHGAGEHGHGSHAHD